MATYPEYDIQDLSDFSGRDVSEYVNTGYVPTAISQALLLYKLGTCLNSWPDDPTMAELAKMAVLSMADAIYLVQPFQKILSNPFSSETIGSYSYSKVAGAVMGGLPTGIAWFDMAISKLSVCDLNDGISMGGGIQVFEDDGLFAQGVGSNIQFLSPEDLNRHQAWIRDPSPGYMYPTTSVTSKGGQSVSGGSVSTDDGEV